MNDLVQIPSSLLGFLTQEVVEYKDNLAISNSQATKLKENLENLQAEHNALLAEYSKVKGLLEEIEKPPRYIVKISTLGEGNTNMALFNSPQSIRNFLNNHFNEQYQTVEELWINSSTTTPPRYYKQDISIKALRMPLTTWLLRVEEIEK